MIIITIIITITTIIIIIIITIIITIIKGTDVPSLLLPDLWQWTEGTGLYLELLVRPGLGLALSHWDLDFEALSSGSSSRVSASGPTSSPHKGNGSISALLLTEALLTQLSPLRELGLEALSRGLLLTGGSSVVVQGSTPSCVESWVMRLTSALAYMQDRAHPHPQLLNCGWAREWPIRAEWITQNAKITSSLARFWGGRMCLLSLFSSDFLAWLDLVIFSLQMSGLWTYNFFALQSIPMLWDLGIFEGKNWGRNSQVQPCSLGTKFYKSNNLWPLPVWLAAPRIASCKRIFSPTPFHRDIQPQLSQRHHQPNSHFSPSVVWWVEELCCRFSCMLRQVVACRSIYVERVLKGGR